MMPPASNPPRRIASLLASATEILYGLGLGDRVIAVSHECDFPVEATSKPCVTRAHLRSEQSSREIDDQVKRTVAAGLPLYEVDWPRLAALRPDLIVTQSQCDVCAVSFDDVILTVNSLPAFQNTRVVSLNPVTIEDVLADVRRIGAATSANESAARYIASLTARIDAIKSITDLLAANARPRVCCIEWIEPMMVSANWMPRLVEWAGGQNGLTEDGRHSTYTAWRDVVAYDPEVIVVMPCGFDLDRTIGESRVLAALEQWEQLAAVKAARVFAVDGNAFFNRSGPRIVDSLEILAHLVQPELFAAPRFSYTDAQPWCRLSTADGQIVAERT